MTIKEKAKDFEGLKSDLNDVLADLFKSLAYKGYMEGANWMLEKAVKRFSSDIDEINNLLGFIDEKAAELIDKEKSIEKFRKSMEEE